MQETKGLSESLSDTIPFNTSTFSEGVRRRNISSSEMHYESD